MRRFMPVAILAFLILGLAPALPSGAQAQEVVEVQVAPHTIRLSSTQPDFITVHAAIDYGRVDTASITLNGVAVAWTKADDRGELVAKFREADVKAILSAPRTTLVLVGLTVDGTEFTGEDTVQVKD